MLAGSSVALAGPALAAEPEVAAQAFPKDAAEALSRLKAGNARFAAGQTRHAHESANWRKQLVGGQKPFATILGCSDSRVPVELVFDQGFGDLFVVRVAGNVISPDVVGSLTYALVHLRTPLFVVVGHQQCGAVTAALAALAGSSKEPPGIRALVELIEPGLPKDLAGDLTEQRVNAAVEANVGWSIKQLRALPGAKATFDKQQIALLGGVYELGTGRVRFLNA
jgi:carbonic anhydrase